MNITHFVENLNRGGLERVVIELIKVQHKHGHRCQVICLFERGALADELTSIGVPVEHCSKKSGLDFRAIGRARAMMRRHSTEILHTHNAMANYYGVLASLNLRLKFRVNTRHGMGGLGRHLRSDWLYRMSLSFTDVVASVCEAARDDVVVHRLASANKSTAVPNGIPMGRLQRKSDAAHHALCASLGLPAETRIVGTVGRLHPAKDHVGLVDAFEQVLTRHPHSALLIVGDGKLREDIVGHAEQLGVADKVFMLGDRDDVHALLPGFDLFVMSSLTEGYSVALLEACATGLPIIATSVGGNGEIVRDGVNGILVPPAEPELLAQAVDVLLDDHELASKMGQAGQDWFMQFGSVDAMAARYDTIYCMERAN